MNSRELLKVYQSVQAISVSASSSAGASQEQSRRPQGQDSFETIFKKAVADEKKKAQGQKKAA